MYYLFLKAKSYLGIGDWAQSPIPIQAENAIKKLIKNIKNNYFNKFLLIFKYLNGKKL